MNSASRRCIGTGACDALFLGCPTFPQVQVCRTWMSDPSKFTSSHCKSKHSEMRRPRTGGEQRQGSFRFRRIDQNCEGLLRTQNHRFVVADGLAADKAQRVALFPARNESVALSV